MVSGVGLTCTRIRDTISYGVFLVIGLISTVTAIACKPEVTCDSFLEGKNKKPYLISSRHFQAPIGFFAPL